MSNTLCHAYIYSTHAFFFTISHILPNSEQNTAKSWMEGLVVREQIHLDDECLPYLRLNN